VILSDIPGQVMLTTLRADKRVAGVISTAPGWVVNIKEGEERLPLALVGQTYCKVNAENDEINIGDLLITSNIPGFAEKAPEHPTPGTIFAKAWQPIKKRKGIISVLTNVGLGG
jgi:hypothetical protein